MMGLKHKYKMVKYLRSTVKVYSISS